MLIVTNIASFPAAWTAADGTSGRTQLARNTADFLRFRDAKDAVFLVNCASRIVLDLAWRRVLSPRRYPPLVALDLVFLRRPDTLMGNIALVAKRLLLKKVDYFIHYVRDLDALDTLYGIGPDRSGFLDFKANLWNARADGARPDGEYALCFGRSLRDFDTFFAAVERLEVAAAIVDPNLATLKEHGSRFSRQIASLPPNVRVLPDDGTERSQAAAMRGAKVVVVPMVKGRLIGAGISTILNAMLLGKCVIATAGPGVTDIFNGQIVSVPPEDPQALAAAIQHVYSDAQLRQRIAQAGWEYANWCGSESDFNQRVIDNVAKRFSSRSRNGHTSPG